MKVLIIGSKGFIGNHAFNYFSARPGIDCWGCDVVTDYTRTNYFLLDSTNSDFNEIFSNTAFDVCINCSGAASVPDSFRSPFRDLTLNTYNVAKMLEAIRKHSGHCKFINLSSAAVYGNPMRLPVNEKDACRPVSPYGTHKLFAEQLCREYSDHFQLKTASLRIFSAYGPGLKKQLLWDIFQKSKVQKTIELLGTGNETRDFIYVYDIIKAIEVVMEKGLFNASVYNVAGGVEVSVKQIAENLLYELGFKGEIRFSGTVRAGDPVNWVADISSLTNLEFYPTVDIKAGIKKYVSWLKAENLVT